MDRSPAEVVATLLDEEVYLCSERTMYRVLASEVPVQERRAQRTHPEYKKPELMATAPNQVWSWDITRLLGPKKWSYYYLYVITPGGRLHQSSHPFPHHTGHCSLINPVECPIIVDRFRFFTLCKSPGS